jgi:hypothetical protein
MTQEGRNKTSGTGKERQVERVSFLYSRQYDFPPHLQDAFKGNTFTDKSRLV